jgi:hypothetical protein
LLKKFNESNSQLYALQTNGRKIELESPISFSYKVETCPFLLLLLLLLLLSGCYCSVVGKGHDSLKLNVGFVKVHFTPKKYFSAYRHA